MAVLDQAAYQRLIDAAKRQGKTEQDVQSTMQQSGITLAPATPTPSNLGVLGVFGSALKKAEAATPGTYDRRNNAIISGLGSAATDPTAVTSYLQGQQGFMDSTESERQNTINNIIQRAKATSATPSNPAVVKGVTEPSDLEYDETNPEDFLMRINAKRAMGEKTTFNDIYNYQRAIAQQKKNQIGGQTDYEAQAAAKLAEQEAVAKTREDAAVSSKQAELDKKYAILKQQQEEANRQSMEASQRNLGFSGFGFSSRAREVSTNLQNQAQAAMSLLDQQKQAELDKYKAEQAGITGKALEPYINRVTKLQEATAKAQADAIAETAKANAEGGATMAEAISNLSKISSLSGQKLDEKGFEQAAKAYNGLKTEEEKQAFLANYTPQEQMYLKGLGNVSAEAAKTITRKVGKNEYIFQWNPKTGLYDIPVGNNIPGGTGSGGLGKAGQSDAAVSASTLLNDPNLGKSVGVMSYLGDVRGTPQFAFKKKVDTFINNLVLPKLKYLKGPTSDKDINFIRSAATSLDVGLDESSFRKTLLDMGATLAKYDNNGNPIGSSQTSETQGQNSSGVDAALALMQ